MRSSRPGLKDVLSPVTALLQHRQACMPCLRARCWGYREAAGKRCHAGCRYLVIKKSWPSGMRTLSGDHARFETVYFRVYPGYYFTGDGCRRDADGYYWLIGAQAAARASTPHPPHQLCCHTGGHAARMQGAWMTSSTSAATA